MRIGVVVAISNTIHTTSASTIDTAKDIVFSGVAFGQNLECSAIDGDIAIAIEWVVDGDIASMSTTSTSAIKLGNDNAVVDICVLIVFRFCGVEGDVGSSHKRVVWGSICLVVVFESKWSLSTQCAVYHTCHLATLYHYIYVAIHSALVVTCQDYAYIIIVLSLFSFFTLISILYLDISFIVMLIVPLSVYVHSDGTFYRHIWSSHHSIKRAIVVRSLTTAYADNRIEARQYIDFETLFAMRHRFGKGFDILLFAHGVEATIVVNTAKYLNGSSHSALYGTIVVGIFVEAFHHDTFAHLQIVVLAIDVLICVATIVVEGDILEASISPYRQTLFGTKYLYGAIIVCSIPFACDGGIAEEFWIFLLSVLPICVI